VIQLLAAGVLTAVVAFATAFAIVLAGLGAAGASQAEAASGLFALMLATGVLTIGFSLRWRMLVMIAWSTPGAVLLIASGAPAGGFRVAVGAFIAAAALMLIAGVWRPFGRAVAAIPMPLANAMLAGRTRPARRRGPAPPAVGAPRRPWPGPAPVPAPARPDRRAGPASPWPPAARSRPVLPGW
jgi:hypothetical protein